MTNPPTDEMVNVARHAAMTYRSTPEPLEGTQVSISFGQMRAALEAALSHQGEVVKVSDLRGLEQRIEWPPGETEWVILRDDLDALISKAEKV